MTQSLEWTTKEEKMMKEFDEEIKTTKFLNIHLVQDNNM